MTILEIGCGTGHMACELAKVVGPKGKVIAIDSSPEQIQVAQQTAQQANIKNIDFHICRVEDLGKLNKNYDATYGRWVIEFLSEPEKVLNVMYRYLNKGGLLAYEACSIKQSAFFSRPHSSIPAEFHSVGPKSFPHYNDGQIEFSHEIYHLFKKLNCHNITMKPTQGILTTPEEKSVYRLGMLTAENALIEKNIMTKAEIEDFAKRAYEFERSDSIAGFYLNYHIGGLK